MLKIRREIVNKVTKWMNSLIATAHNLNRRMSKRLNRKKIMSKMKCKKKKYKRRVMIILQMKSIKKMSLIIKTNKIKTISKFSKTNRMKPSSKIHKLNSKRKRSNSLKKIRATKEKKKTQK